MLLIGVAVVLISAILVFFVSFKVMKESSYEEVAAEKSRRERAIEEDLGISGKDAKKDKKKKKEKKGKEVVKPTDETEVTAGSSDDSEERELSKPNVVESKKLVKGKKQKSLDAGNESVQSTGKTPEKTDSKKPGKTSQSAGNAVSGEKKVAKPSGGAKENTAQGSKAQSAKARKEQDDFQSLPEADTPFIVAESKHKKKKQAATAEASASSKTVARETIATVVSPKVDTPTKVEAKSPAKEASNLKINPSKVLEPGIKWFTDTFHVLSSIYSQTNNLTLNMMLSIDCEGELVAWVPCACMGPSLVTLLFSVHCSAY